jgi:chemotaxis protein methyltransferase CheR
MLLICNQQAQSMDSLDFDYLRQLVYLNSAVFIDADKEYLAELHLTNLAEETGFDSIIQFVKHLKTLPFGNLHVQAIESLLNYETTFFRDTYPFEILKELILPKIIKRHQEIINIWCAASSSGQEPYSIAMLLKEEKMLDTVSLQLIASDISDKILARARQGIYNQVEIRRGLPTTLQKKYFHPIINGSEWQINEDIRNMVDFRKINLLDSWCELPKMDIIFLRNVLIYFETPTKKKILSKIKDLLKPDGYLFLGGGETTINLNDEFERIQFAKGSCYRVGNGE